MLLEQRLDRRLDLLDAAHDLLDLIARLAVEKGNARPRARGITSRLHLVERTIRNEAQDHRELHIDMTAEGTGEADAIDVIDAELVHEKPRTCIERGLGELDGAHVVLGD